MFPFFHYHSAWLSTYLPTPPLGQDMTQGQFLRLDDPLVAQNSKEFSPSCFLGLIIIIIIIIYNFFILSVSHGFSSQLRRTTLSIFTDFNSSMVCMVLIFPQISRISTLFSMNLKTNRMVSFEIVKMLMINVLICSRRSGHLSSFSLSFADDKFFSSC